MEDSNYSPTWKNRRRVIFLTLIFCAVCVSYIMIKGEDNEVNKVIVMWSFLLSGGTIGSYVFGATWESIRLK